MLLILAVMMTLEAVPDAVDLWRRLKGAAHRDKLVQEQPPTRLFDRILDAGYDIMMLLVDFVTVILTLMEFRRAKTYSM